MNESIRTIKYDKENDMFKRILVAVDGSHMADQALQEAIKLAREMQAKLRIVHAVDTVNINLDTEFPERATMSDVAIEFGQKTLRNAEAVAKKSGIATETHLIEIDTLGHHWTTMPSKTLVTAIVAVTFTGTVLTFVGLSGLMPLPWRQTLAIFAYAMVSCLVVNDSVKVAMIKWRVPAAIA